MSEIIEIAEDEFERIMASIALMREDRAKRLPDDEACLKAIMDAYLRMEELGWTHIMHMRPYEVVDVVTVGSTGVRRGHKDESGRYWCEDGGDLWPDYPFAFRRIKKQNDGDDHG